MTIGLPGTGTQARAALRDVVGDLVALLRRVPDATAPSVGTWTVGDVAAHLSHVFRFDTDAVAGKPVPETTVTAAGMAELNATMLAEDGERDPLALADRIDALAGEFDDVVSGADTATVGWLGGTRLPPSVVACHLLEECLIHGHDIARATGERWTIRPHHAVLAVEGGVLPLIAALPPTAFVNQEKAGSFRARFEVRLLGGGRTVLAFDNGTLTLGTDGTDGTDGVDAYLSADAPALMLVFIGRQAIWTPLSRGKLAAWGRRPWRLARMLTAISPP